MASDRTECIVKHQRADSVLAGCEVDCFAFSDNLVPFATDKSTQFHSVELCTHKKVNSIVLQSSRIPDRFELYRLVFLSDCFS